MDINIRALAAQVLTPVLQNKGSLNTQLASVEARCPEKDRALLRELCLGTLRFYPQLNEVLKSLQHRPFKYKDVDVRAIALLGLYQLQHTRIAPHAAINESVGACKQFNKIGAAKLINALLRRFQREKDNLLAELESNEVYAFNHPEWMIAKLKNNWPEHWQAILHANNEQAPLTLRVNQKATSREDYLTQLTQAISASPTPFSPCGIRLEQSVNVTQLPGYAVGAFSVQDEAAQLCANLLDLAPNQRVLDACAAPGGKLTHILECQPKLTQVDAVELEPKRIGRIDENLKRLRLQANIIEGNAASQSWWDGEPYDRILLDAPCSATGVIRRNPDIKYLRKGEDIHTLSLLQLQILENCWSMLKAGGKLVYATCSVFPQENERLIARFMKQQNDAVHHPIDAEWGIARKYGRQLFPQPHGHDGFYYAVLEKQSKLNS